MFHYRKSRNKYTSYPKPKACPFCDETELAHAKLLQTKHAYVTPNRVFYDIWELQDVEDHLLLIPNRHVKSLHELTSEEQSEIIKIIGDYEARGYNVYARAKDSRQRSVGHQHTHLIKIKHTPVRAMLFFRRPYWLIKF